MSTFLSNVDAGFTATLLAAAMFVAWMTAWSMGRRLKPEPCESTSSNKASDATLALLGLLLAFTFSMSLGKHDQRRQMLVADSNAIGDFYTCASLVKEPVRGKLQAVVRQYTEHRLALPTTPDEATLERKLAEIQDLQSRMQTLVSAAVEEGTPLAVPLVNTLNALTSSHAARLAAVRDRLPGTIVGLLMFAAVVAAAVVGRQQGTLGERRHGAMLGFIALVSLVVWVTLDLNQPNRGFITVSQEPLQRLLAGMAK